MSKVLAIDPGKSKCGLVLAHLEEQKVYKAEVIESKDFLSYFKKIYKKEKNLKLIIGNGTSSKNYLKHLNQLVPDLIIAEEKNSTYRAKNRYFDIFPLQGIKCLLPREIFLLNKNLDALAALIILEDFYGTKFDVSEISGIKTWLK